jgi:hypothetical protein
MPFAQQLKGDVTLENYLYSWLCFMCACVCTYVCMSTHTYTHNFM